MDTTPLIRVDRPQGSAISTVIFNTGDPHNRVGLTQLDAILERIEAEVESNSEIVILSGGVSQFCAGASEDTLNSLGMPDSATMIQNRIAPAFLRLRQSPKLLITAIAGNAVGVGVNLAMIGHIRVMHRRSSLFMNFGAHGLVPEYTLTSDLVKEIGPTRALSLLLRGTPVRSQECTDLGLAVQSTHQDPTHHAIELAQGLLHHNVNGSIPRTVRLVNSARDASVSDSHTHSVDEMIQAFRSLPTS